MNVLIMRRLQERARSEASFAGQGLAELEKEHNEVRLLEEDLARRLELARNAMSRAQAFKPRGSDSYRCPCCAVYTNENTDLTEVLADAGHRHFVCGYCGNEFDFEMKAQN